MKMLLNQKELFASSNESSVSNTHSMNSSFSADSSWDPSSMVHTPTSSGGLSFASVKVEDMSFSGPPTSCTSNGYGGCHNFLEMPIITQEMMSAFQDPNIVFAEDNTKLHDQDVMGYHNFSTYTGSTCDSMQSNNGLPNLSMDLDTYSPTTSCQVSGHCVAPSQTTFLDPFDMQSPVGPIKSLQFDLQYDSSGSEYTTDYSFGISPTESFESFNSSFSDSSSASNTPSRHAQIRHPIFEPLQSSAALHRVQNVERPDTKAEVARQVRRRTKRESRNFMIPCLRVEKEATKPCTWVGCGRKFKRQEHLKRHEISHTGVEPNQCPFCPKKFGRGDNFKQHIKLHAEPPKKSSRTSHFAEAIALLALMNKKPRKDNLKKDIKAPRTRVLRY